MVNSERYEVTQALRSALKAKGMTYRDLAGAINVSEQTVKRFFREKDCSLSRLSSICQAIGISLYDLLDYSRHHAEPLAELTLDQERYLRDHPSHFSFLFFMITDHTVDEIQETYQLTDAVVFRYLRDLEKQGFISLGEENRFRLLIEGKLLMRLHGPLHDRIRKENQRFLDHVLDHDGQERARFSSSFRYMSASTLDEMTQELDEIHKKYRKLAHQDEMVLPRESLVPTKVTTLVAPYAVCGKWSLDRELD
ncbi:helix-turn-helix domain-containing protein [Endozoicomonas arenosclerae]|uniref:helix-turn-helix domain-containing protein n=1 Tax=Endozoicomonas arenosclerae TaxID=1633495 RepID=UPI000784C7DC|nr:helix-turn-helix transcriptional regulator [Endozoicomonas arenosclerae]